MPIERRIRDGARRNADVLDPDVDRFLGSVVRKTHRRQVIHRSLSIAASVVVVVLAVVLGPSVLRDIGGSGDAVPGSSPTLSVGPSVTPGVPLLTGTFTRTISEGTAVVRANGIAGTWTINADADGSVRLLAPATFAGAHVLRSVPDAGGQPSDATRSAPTSVPASPPARTGGCWWMGRSWCSRSSPTLVTAVWWS